MAMTHVISITSPTMVSLPLRANSISCSRVNNNNIVPYKSKYTRRLHVKNATSFHSDQFSNSRVDQKLVKVLEYEITSMEGRSLFECTKSKMPILPPADFPFSIDEYSGEGSIIKFKREVHGEHIEVCVCEPISALTDHDDTTNTPILLGVSEIPYKNDIRPLTGYSMCSDTDGEDDNDFDDEISIRVVPLLVKIIKKDGTFMDMTVFGSADVIFIKRMDIHAPSSDGTSFEVHSIPKQRFGMEMDVEYSMKEFIEARGINKTNAEFWLKLYDDYYKYHREFDFLKAFKHYINSPQVS